MPADDSKIVDESTTVTMIVKFGEVQDECQRIQNLVDTAHSALMGRWGGEAAAAFDSSMTQWKEGFGKVRASLSMLNDAMTQYARITNSTEDDNVVAAGGWATPGTHFRSVNPTIAAGPATPQFRAGSVHAAVPAVQSLQGPAAPMLQNAPVESPPATETL